MLLLVGGGVLVWGGIVEVGGDGERFIRVEVEEDECMLVLIGWELILEEKKFLIGWELILEVGGFKVLNLFRFEKFVIGCDLVIKEVIFRVLKLFIGGCISWFLDEGGSFDWKVRGGKGFCNGWGVIFKSWFLKDIWELGKEIGVVGVIGISLFLSIW